MTTHKVKVQHPELTGLFDKDDIVEVSPKFDSNGNYEQFRVKSKCGLWYTEDELCSMIGNFTQNDLFEKL